MEEWLLLDRVTLHTRDVTERDAQLAPLVETHATNPAAPSADKTAVAASETTNPVPLCPPQRANGRVTIQHIGHGSVGRAGLCGAAGRNRTGSGRRVLSYITHKAHQQLQTIFRRGGALSKPRFPRRAERIESAG